ncbi:hypothetical protein Agabi119p4_7916 [Agaricus bisporus var. burnettii]|uniref:Uncharacterized protein n=1 Tax=Agaricus bisporus var. burnettii TaxID=192524 RepID=A0A8H7C909_AGABI|nr:hypothetical protein Agabi119p4_7916 [Agaricus bisporus var. burnettii]
MDYRSLPEPTKKYILIGLPQSVRRDSDSGQIHAHRQGLALQKVNYTPFWLQIQHERQLGNSAPWFIFTQAPRLKFFRIVPICWYLGTY